jgi:LysR family transcriptional regulator, transcription activator of glutamate synthase operon
MRFQEFNALIEAARHGSISKASEELHISHTALGKQIRNLEAYYGVQLLKRKSSGVIPTEAGSYVINRVSDLLFEMESIRNELRVYRKPARYMIGSLPSLAGTFLPDRVLAMKMGGVDCEVQIMQNSGELWEGLKGGRLDGILAETASENDYLFTKVLFKEPFVTVVYKEHPFGKVQSIHPRDLNGQPLILYPEGCGIRKWVAKTMRQSGYEPTITSEVGFGGFIAGMVVARAGITVLPESAAKRLGEPDLITLPFSGTDAYRTIVFASSSQELGKRLIPYFV